MKLNLEVQYQNPLSGEDRWIFNNQNQSDAILFLP